MRLLVTRPEPDNERSAAQLRALGHEVTLAPLLRIEAVVDADLDRTPFGGILLTSANAARAIAVHPRLAELRALPVLVVGQGTADAARMAGFSDVASADGDGHDLARLAAAFLAGSPLPILYLAGEERARDLAGELSEYGLAVRTVAVYRAAKAKSLSPPARAALAQGRIDGVLHFSRRSAENYLDCTRDMAELALAPVQYCLSVRVAEPLLAAGAERIRVASQPDQASLLALVTPTASQNRLE